MHVSKKNETKNEQKNKEHKKIDVEKFLSFQGYLFDMDETLIESDGIIAFSSLAFMEKTYGTKFPDSYPKSLAELLMKQIVFKSKVLKVYEHFKEIVNNKGHTKEFFVKSFLEMKFQSYNKVKTFPHTLEFLTLLKKKKPKSKFAIVTTEQRREAQKVVEMHKMKDFFEVIITSDDYESKHAKPHPKPFEMGAEFIKVDTKNCCAFEDSQSGIDSAKKAGCFVIGIANGKKDGSRLKNADFVTSFEELIKLLKK